jgi:hypothetical protein
MCIYGRLDSPPTTAPCHCEEFHGSETQLKNLSLFQELDVSPPLDMAKCAKRCSGLALLAEPEFYAKDGRDVVSTFLRRDDPAAVGPRL